jgi:DNA repair protein RecO (recombination protein O)
MPLFTTEALVLRTYKLGEADRIVVFLTRDRGKKRGVAAGARRMKSKFGGALEPLTRVGLTYYEREGRELVSLNYAEPLGSPLWTSRAEALGHTGYFAELMDEWAQESDPSETLFRLGCSTADAMVAGVAIEPLARYFEYWLLRLQGVYPSLSTCGQCGGRLGSSGDPAAVLMPGERDYRCPSCARAVSRAVPLPGAALGFLRALNGVAPLGLDRVSVDGRVVSALERAHGALITMHLEKELRSARVLREMRERDRP